MKTYIETTEDVTHTSSRRRRRIDGPEYSIYNYFRSNTGFAIAVISGVVAVSSFAFRYASTLYNYAYLRFWDIDIAYAKQEDTGVFYVAIGVFCYYAMIVFSQFLLGSTAEAYNHHNRFCIAAKALQKKLNKKRKASERIKKRLTKQLKQETLDKRKDRLKERISNADARISELTLSRADQNVIVTCKLSLIAQSVVSILASFLLCMFGALFLALNYEDGVKNKLFWVLAVAPLLIGLLLCVLQKRPKLNINQDINKELDQYLHEIKEDKTMLFPMEAWVKKGIKYFLTNRLFGAMVLQYFTTVFACIMVLVNSGSTNAEKLQEFRVWTDGFSTYAIIYDNGTQVIMEPINIEETSATIDTSSQRIIKLDDLSYDIYTFENIEIIRSDSNESATTGIASETEFSPTSNN